MTPPAAILALFDQARTITGETVRVSKHHAIIAPEGHESATLEISHGLGTIHYVAQFHATVGLICGPSRFYEHVAIGASVTEAADNMRAQFVAWWEQQGDLQTH